MQRKNIQAQVLDELGRKIAGGVYAPGGRMPTEPVLAEEFQVSRLLVREAIKSLAAKGMVTVRPRTGTQVSPRSSWNLLDRQVLEWQFAAGMNETVLDDLIEFRLMIEPQAARLACQHATAADIDILGDAVRRMEEAAYGQEYIEADLFFHIAVLKACHNLIVMQFEPALAELLKISFGASTGNPASRPHAMALHRDLMQAIEKRESDTAERLSRQIIRNAGALIRKAPPDDTAGKS